MESRLRRVVRSAVRASPVLRAQARRHRKQHRRQYSADYALARILGTAWLVVLLMLGPGRYRLTALALWALASTLSGATRLRSLLEGDRERQPLLHLPVADNLVCNRQGWKFIGGSLWLWADGMAAYGFLGWGPEGIGSFPWAWIPVFGALHWLLTLALSVAVAQHRRVARQRVWILVALWSCFLALCVPGTSLRSWLVAGFAESADWITLVLPTGWPVYLFSRGIIAGEWSALLLLPPMGLAFWIGLKAWRALRTEFSLQDLDSLRIEPRSLAEHAEHSPAEASSQSVGPTALVERIGRRDFLTPRQVWNPDDWLEGWAARWCTPREELLAEVGIDTSLGWSPAWRRALIILLIGNLVAWAWQQSGLKFFGWLDGLILIIVAATTLPTQLNGGSALVGLLPIRLPEVLRLRTKLWLIRSVSALPLFVAAALMLAWRMGWPLSSALAVGMKGSLLLQAAFPYTSLVGVGRNEQLSLGLYSTGYWLLFLICVGSTLGLGLGALIPEFSTGGTWPSWLCALGAILPGWLFAFVYLWRFNRGRVDLCGE